MMFSLYNFVSFCNLQGLIGKFYVYYIDKVENLFFGFVFKGFRIMRSTYKTWFLKMENVGCLMTLEYVYYST